MQRKTNTITDQQEKWVESVIESGNYSNDSEFFRDLIRRDQKRQAAERELRRLLDEAEEGGLSDKTPLEIWAAAEARRNADSG